MAEYYRTVFSVRKRDLRGIPLMEKAADATLLWAMECFGRCEFDSSRGLWTGDRGSLRIRDRKDVETNLAIYRLVWEMPDCDSTNRWRLSARLATDGQDVEADIEVLGIETPNRPLREEYLAKLPATPVQLLSEFDCRIGDLPMITRATKIARDDADSFLNDWLYGPDRQVPLLVVSLDSAGDGVDADQLQEQLLGLASVVVYDHDTAWDVARHVPRALRCYDGAIRLYAPGCSGDDVPQQNPYWMPSDERQLQSQPNRFWMMLRDECVNRTPTHTRRRLFSSVRSRIRRLEAENWEAELNRLEVRESELEDDYERRRQELEADAQSIRKLESERKIAIEELDRAYDELLQDLDDDTTSESAQKTVARAFRNRNKLLEDDIRRLQQDNALLRMRLDRSGSSESAVQDEVVGDQGILRQSDAEAGVESPEFRTVLEAVKAADASFDGLRFFPTAIESARDSQFTRPCEVYRALEVLAECGEARQRDGALGVVVRDWMAERGVDYAASESEQTEIRHSDERKFYDPKRDFHVYMGAHIRVGRNQVRIHVVWHDAEGKWLVGWVGDHLPTAGHNS